MFKSGQKGQNQFVASQKKAEQFLLDKESAKKERSQRIKRLKDIRLKHQAEIAEIAAKNSVEKSSVKNGQEEKTS